MPAKKLTLAQLQQGLESLARVASAQAAIGIRDSEVAAYARVLEYGSIAGQRPWASAGPRTTLAVDPETGAQVVVSTQAPQGFIGVQAPNFAALTAAHLKSSADWLDGESVQAHISEAVQKAGREASELLRTTAPRDSGRLAESIELLSE